MENKTELIKVANACSQIIESGRKLNLSPAQISGLIIQLNSVFSVLRNQVPVSEKIYFNQHPFPEFFD